MNGSGGSTRTEHSHSTGEANSLGAAPGWTAVVGIDGSEHARAALAWAVHTVGHAGQVVALTVGRTMADSVEGSGDTSRAASHRDPDTAWHESVEPAGTMMRRVLIDTDDVAEALVSAAVSHGADFVAVGAHTGPAMLPRAVGSTTHKVLRLADVPVAVVKAPWSAPAINAPIVTGVGSGKATRAAIDWSIATASQQGRPIVLVRSVDLHPMVGLRAPIEMMASYIDPEQLLTWAHREVDDLAKDAARHRVSVTTSVVQGPPGARLVEAAASAAMLVMGKHFDGRFTGYFTGRSLHHALTHAVAPVIVVPSIHGEIS